MNMRESEMESESEFDIFNNDYDSGIGQNVSSSNEDPASMDKIENK
eukprot:CAMPEP_0196998504 /NCGR_PEP_ID=MMETSP1380-20130617/3881_1 /TAXON_ID=5936 /ORGANISM="Euplotes crassus, Strain CT5" /LENGTH=45 /DNA_ID= /DNA_START= /DNA_END= /DNA_ORIENTATION=